MNRLSTYVIPLIILSTTLFSSSLFAEEPPCDEALLNFSVESSRSNALTFKDVEVYRRNNGIGLQQKGDLKLEQWIALETQSESVDNFLGLTQEGKVYQVVAWKSAYRENGKSRNIARLLSADRKISKIFLVDQEILAGVDEAGKVLLYSPKQWLSSPVKGIVKRGLLTWAGSAAVMSAGLYGFDILKPDNLPTVLGFVGVVSGMVGFYPSLVRYENLNTYTDGFVKTSFQYESDEQLKRALQGEGLAYLKSYFSASHFMPPSEADVFPEMIDAATEEIR